MGLVAGPAVAAVAVMAFVPPIPQDQAYHRFADRREWLGIPNFADVVSNAGFIVSGLAGLLAVARRDAASSFREPRERGPFVVLFAAQVLTGIGSAYYHWAPADGRLFWDRLPLTAVAMSLLAIVIAERVSIAAGRRLLVPLLAAGAGSVLFWHLGNGGGHGDLRWYAIVQYYPMAAIPLLLILFPPRYTRTGDYGAVVGWYALAKVCEALDPTIFRATGGNVSGHTLKHLFAAAAAGWLVLMVWKRRPAGQGVDPPRSSSSSSPSGSANCLPSS